MSASRVWTSSISSLRFVSMAVAVCAALFVGGSAQAGSSNSQMDVSADGRLLALSDREKPDVWIVDLKSKQIVQRIPAGKFPEGLSFLGKTHRLAIASYGNDEVLLADADTGKVEARVDVFDEPYGVVSNKAGTKIYVTLEYPGQVVEIDTAEARITRTFEVGRFPRGVALTADQQTLVIVEYYSTLVHALDLKTGALVDAWKGASTDNLARQICTHPTRPKAYLSHIRSRVTAARGAGSIFPYVSAIDMFPKEGKRRRRIPMDAFRGNLVVANPWEVAIAPDGKRLYAVFSGTNDMFVCGVLDDDYREFTDEGYVRLGRNPRAVHVAPDGKRVYIYNSLDFEVAVYDAQSLRKVDSIQVAETPDASDAHWLGKVLFYQATQPMVGRRWISCSSCHPDGDADGRVWHNPEGLRATPPLFGLARTHPLHWSSDRDEVQDFEHTIRGPLMAGRGLIKGKVSPSLAAPNKGRSRELDALAAYTNSHPFAPRLSPHAKEGLSQAAQRGRTLFLSEATQCATCHAGPYYSDSSPSAKPPLLHDVGTGNDDDSEIMGPAYDTPTLLGIYRSAPYLHHGRAETLLDVLTTSNAGDKHGKTSHLSKQQLSDLVEFLKALPYEDPLPAAEKAGVTAVVD